MAHSNQEKEPHRHKWRYNYQSRCSKLEPGDTILIRQKAFKGKHKIANCWENTVYVVIDRQDNLPVYKIRPLKEPGKIWVVHNSLLLPNILPSQGLTQMKSDDQTMSHL